MGESDLIFWMFNFSPQLRDTLTRGLFYVLSCLGKDKDDRDGRPYLGFEARSLSVGDLGDAAPT